ncbi:MAG TPA: Ku protein [Spongiibacteraceae bacterium]|nr:Ku protein [Spongiibacteraceae bacterium]
MPRPIWNGVISFGLLNVPVALYTAEKRVDLHFRMIDSRSKKPIRYERVNAETGEEVPWKNIVKAFEYDKGNYVVLSEEEMASVAPEGKESIELEEFVDRTAIPSVFYEKPYYLVPGKKAEKGYVLLREILSNSNRAGIGHVLIRTRRYLAAVLVQDNALILNLLRFDQEIVPLDDFTFPESDLRKLRITDREIEMATQLIDSMTVDWEPTRYVDDYRLRLTKIVEKHLAQSKGLVHEDKAEAAPPKNAATNVVDFMALLKGSLKNRDPKSSAPKKKVPAAKARTAAKKSTKTLQKTTVIKNSAKRPKQKSSLR